LNNKKRIVRINHNTIIVHVFMK